MTFSALLLFDGFIWRGACADFTIWMNDATFQKYVQGYFDFYHMENPTTAQYKQAVEHCRQIVFGLIVGRILIGMSMSSGISEDI